MAIILLSKAFVKEHQRHKKDGSVYTVLAHYNKRVKKNTEHAPEHGHNLSHLSDDDKARFNQMHAEQHLAKHYDEHAIKQELQDSRTEHDKLILDADVQDKLGDHKAATKLRNKAIKVNQRMMRFQRQLFKLDETVQGIGKMKDKLVAGSGELAHDAAAHAHYVSKLGAKFKGRIMFIKKVTKPKQPFIPTHTLSDGMPARHVEGNIYIDKDGNEVQDYYTEPVAGKVDNIDSDNIGADIEDRKACKLKVLEKLKPIFQDNPKVVSSSNGDKIIVAWSGIKHAMNAGLPTWQEAAAALHIESLIAKSTAIEVKPDKLGRDDPKSTTIYQADVKFDGVPHKVSIFVRNHSDGNRYYDHVTIETKNSAGLTGSLAPTLPFAESQEGDQVASDKSIATSPENATQKDIPKEGERNAEGLVFRNGRWHRDDTHDTSKSTYELEALGFKSWANESYLPRESYPKDQALKKLDRLNDNQKGLIFRLSEDKHGGHYVWYKKIEPAQVPANEHRDDEANKPAKVVSIKEVARKPESNPRLAPNGKPSNLNAMQHAQVRTAKFKEWFGDWETIAKLSWLDHGAPVASMSGNEVPTFNGMANLADWIAKNWIDRKESIIERSDLGKINIDRKSVKDSAAHGLSKAKVQAYYLVPDVLKSGVLLGEMPPQNNKPRASVIAAPVVIGNVQYKMYIEVRHDENMRRMYVHEAVLREDDSTEAFKTSAATHKEAKPQGAPRGALFSFIQNLRDVKSSKVIDENGEPMVVYHGTNADFDTFKYQDEVKRYGAQTQWMGFFFANNEDFSASFAPIGKGSANLMPVFLNMRSPYHANEADIERYNENNADENEAESVDLDKKGYDGIKILDDSDRYQELAVFNPNQIKSAIGNSGGFSKESNDIRKSLVASGHKAVPPNTLILFNIRARRVDA